MPESPHELAPVPTRSRLRGLLNQIASRWFAVERRGVSAAPSQEQSEGPPAPLSDSQEAAARAVAGSGRQHRELWRILLSVVPFVGSGVAVGWAFRSFYGGPMLPQSVFAIGSLVWLVAGGAIRLARGGARPRAGTPADRGRPRAEHVLWAALALF